MDEIRVEGSHGAAGHDRPACLAPGCTCRDARIVSRRKAAFFGALARMHGQTANRFVPADPDWQLPARER